MQYTRGVRGPSHEHEIEIDSFEENPGANMIKGTAFLRTQKELKGVSFIAQGKNADALRPSLAKGAKLKVQVRWVGSYSVTITGIVTEGAKAAQAAAKKTKFSRFDDMLTAGLKAAATA
jgi:hypothetical protein